MNPNVVLVGHGYWGKNIARNLHELGALYGVCDPDEEAIRQAREAYGDFAVYTAFADVLADENVAAVAISTHAKVHATLALQAMEAGKDVFVEKPLALNYRDGRQVAKAAERLGRILMVGHLLEYHPAVQALDTLVRAGELGVLQYLYSNRLNL